MSDDLVERVARAMLKTQGASFEAVPEHVRIMAKDYARAAIAVVLEEAAKVADAIESETWRLPLSSRGGSEA